MTKSSHRLRAAQRAAEVLTPNSFITTFEHGRAVDHRVMGVSREAIQATMKDIDPLEVIEFSSKSEKRTMVSFRDGPEAHLAEVTPLLEAARAAGQ